ncbi:uncharacterized protein LOC122919634 [Bufo gargarizans]|uniref:uncharacterized protein LOC122919634 n=1 Tax=Bufo gargarizans TaxID=30331 RepID=UPI001CF5A97A|nr:uncharacterized protein LOC122919634 [Bufo gargarizans]
MNIYADITNTPLALHDKERNESIRTEISVQSALKNNDGTVSPVIFQENLPPVLHEIQFSSPDCHSESNILGISNMPLSYFTDPIVPNENEQEQESVQIASINCNKYFSTPMPSKERVRKKLTPVMEVEFESNMSEEWDPQDKVPRIDELHKADVLSHESPTETLLYRTFFAAECQEIVNQIENIETEVKSPGKRKLEEFESIIDSELPPYDCTPMKSMLACEVAKMLCSLESSPLKEGVSLFGESLLDLEKTDMQITDFNLSECGTKNNKVHSLSETAELSFLSDRLDGICVKRQKIEPFEKTYPGVDPVNHINKMSPLAPEVPTIKPVHSYATSKCDESVTTALPKNLLHMEHALSDDKTEPAVLVEDTAVVQNVSQVIKASLQDLITTTRSPTPVHEITKGCIRQFTDTGEIKLCASTRQPIALTYDDLPSTDIAQETEASKSPPNTRQSFISISDEMNIANATREIEILPNNKTVDIPCSQEEVSIFNTALVSEMVGLPSGCTTQDIDLVSDIISGNTIHIIDGLSLSANIAQDISPTPEVVTTDNATQIIETGPQCPVNTTEDLTSMHENKTTNNEMEMVAQSCLNATQDMTASDVDVIANTTLAAEVEPQFVHDVSVFTVGSLSFITSTPVPGLNDFEFQKSGKEPVQHDPNMSSGSVFDYSTNKVHRDLRMITQKRPHVAQGLNCNDEGKPETSQGSFFPPSMQIGMVHSSAAMPKPMSGIPSARRSLALHQNSSQNPAREQTGSKIAPRGIPGKGMIRPPMARQSLPRPSLGKPKQAMEGAGGGNITNKFTGNRLKTPKAPAVKVKSGTTHSQLPTALSVKPPTRFGVTGHTGRLSVGSQNAVANLQDTRSGETVLVVRPPTSTGVRTGLPRPGTSSIRPPLLQSQKVSPKLKFQGLPTKKNLGELPTLGLRKEIGLKAESTSAVRSTAKQTTPSLGVPKEAASFEASFQANASSNHAVQTKAENHKVYSSLTAKEEIERSPTNSTEFAESIHDGCKHLEICKCCHLRYHKLLQENEDLKRRLGHVLPTQVEVTRMAMKSEDLDRI